MFPVAHGWLLVRVIEDASPASFLGCVWPDMLFGSPLAHHQTHHSGDALLAYAHRMPEGVEREEFIEFVQGVISHGVAPTGFDHFSDEAYGDDAEDAKGYAFQRGALFAARAATACGIPEELGLWKAHNIIEMAFERSLFHANTPAAQSLIAACANTDLMQRMAEPLAQFFGVEPTALTECMRRYPEMVELTPTSHEALAQAYAYQTRYRHESAHPDKSALADLIGEAEALVAPDRDTYLTTCLNGVSVALATCAVTL